MSREPSTRGLFDRPCAEVSLERTAGGFRLVDARFGIRAEATDLSDAYKQLLDARDEVVRVHREAGQPVDLDPPPELWSGGRVAGVALLALGVALGILVQLVAQRIGSTVEHVEAVADARLSGRAVAGFVSSLADAADRMSESREAELRQDVRRIVARAVPLIEEIRPVIGALLGESADEGPTGEIEPVAADPGDTQ